MAFHRRPPAIGILEIFGDIYDPSDDPSGIKIGKVSSFMKNVGSQVDSLLFTKKCDDGLDELPDEFSKIFKDFQNVLTTNAVDQDSVLGFFWQLLEFLHRFNIFGSTEPRWPYLENVLSDVLLSCILKLVDYLAENFVFIKNILLSKEIAGYRYILTKCRLAPTEKALTIIDDGMTGADRRGANKNAILTGKLEILDRVVREYCNPTHFDLTPCNDFIPKPRNNHYTLGSAFVDED